MSDEITRNLPGGTSFEERVFAEFARLNARLDSMDKRLVSLEAKVDARLRETRPIWEGIQTTLNDMNAQLKLVVADLFRTRAQVEQLEERLRPPA